ncbi:NADP-dependent isocitrate dehydrogenase [Thermodesulfobacteriota bacterium]
MSMADKIRIEQGRLAVPDYPIIPFIEGDGIGVDITPAMRAVVDAAVKRAYGESRRIEWKEVLAGEKANEACGEYLPKSALETLRDYVVGIKGPLTTPVGGGFRSLNVTIRIALDLYSCVRPVKWYGSASPLKHPERVDIVVFRENTEDVYSGVEYASESPEVLRLIGLLRDLGVGVDKVAPDAAISIKPMSPTRSKRHVRKAFRWAMEHCRESVTIMHKGNIMKHTEGSFARWAYEVTGEPEFEATFRKEGDAVGTGEPGTGEGMIPVNDRIADNMFQQLLTRTEEYDMIVTTNLNGDYISDAAAGCVGGLGMAPGANIGEFHAVFEATHGSAPKYAGRNKANPGSLILSAAMMLEYMKWWEASVLIEEAFKKTLAERRGTYDLVRGWKREGETGTVELTCSEFAAVLAGNI